MPLEREGLVIVEAEAFVKQERVDVRRWHTFQGEVMPLAELGDVSRERLKTASGRSCIQILPDTRVTRADKLEHGVSFSNEPGVLGILHYSVFFENAGRYYVWVRAYSTGSEDNGLHVDLNGEWPESGQRMQWCEGKHQWTWGNRQRTEEVHCGLPDLIYLDIPHPGLHTISFSMREDGFAFDKFLLVNQKSYSVSDSFNHLLSTRSCE